MPFTWSAVVLSVVLAAVQLYIGASTGEVDIELTLLVLLLINETGFLICVFGVGTGILDIINSRERPDILIALFLCVAFAVGFAWVGISLWPSI